MLDSYLQFCLESIFMGQFWTTSVVGLDVDRIRQFYSLSSMGLGHNNTGPDNGLCHKLSTGHIYLMFHIPSK